MFNSSSAENRCSFVLLAVLLLTSLGVNVFLFAFPLFALQQQLPGGWVGAVFSGYFLARLLAAPLAGFLSDSWSPRFLLPGTTLFCAVAAGGCYLSLSPQMLLSVQFCLGLGTGTIKTVALALLAKLAPAKRRGRIFGWSNAATNAVFFVGPACGGLLFFYSQMQLIPAFLSVCMLLSTLLLLRCPLHSTVEKSADDRQQRAETVIPRPHRIGETSALLAAICGRTLGISTLLTFFPMMAAAQLHLPAWRIGLLVAVPGGISCILLPLTGRLADTLPRSFLTLFGLLLSATALLFAPAADSITAFLLIGVATGVGSALSLPSSMHLATTTPDSSGTAMGMFQTAAGVGLLLGPMISGVLVQYSGSAATGLQAAGVLGAVSCIPFAITLFCGRVSFGTREHSHPARRVIAVLPLITLAVALPSFITNLTAARERFHGNTELQTAAGLAMGGIVHIKMAGEKEKTAEAAERAFAEINRLQQEYDHRSIDGAIGRINRAAGKEAVAVSDSTFALIKRALLVGERSEGVFDITIGAVSVLPFYYRNAAAEEKKSLVDYSKVLLDEKKRTVFLPEQGMALDLGGLAKGSIVDAATGILKDAGITAALIEASGDFFCYGDRSWRVGIQDPRSSELLGIIEVKNAGVCGSGDYYQYETADGERRHHILNPALLRSAQKSIGVTTVAPSAELADALATTLFIMGPEQGKKFLRKWPNCSALWVLPDGTLSASRGFPRLQPLKL